MSMQVRNRFTGEVLHTAVTPLDGAHVVVKLGAASYHEYHRGTHTTSHAWLRGLVDAQPDIWEDVTD